MNTKSCPSSVTIGLWNHMKQNSDFSQARQGAFGKESSVSTTIFRELNTHWIGCPYKNRLKKNHLLRNAIRDSSFYIFMIIRLVSLRKWVLSQIFIRVEDELIWIVLMFPVYFYQRKMIFMVQLSFWWPHRLAFESETNRGAPQKANERGCIMVYTFVLWIILLDHKFKNYKQKAVLLWIFTWSRDWYFRNL